MDFAFSDALFETLRGFHLYVGFSGGADSTALLLLTLETASRFDCRVTAVHFNHHLRGAESDKEAENAEKFANAHCVPFLRYDLDCGGGSEADAREARLAVWKELAANKERVAVLLGHHADDRAENLLLRLARGSNATGATALRDRAVVAGVCFIRPLLKFHRKEIEEYLRSRGITLWAQDSSNFKETAKRNGVRLRLLPALYNIFPEAESGLQRSLDALESDARFIEETAEKEYRTGDPHRRSFWKDQPEALGFRLFRRFCSELSQTDLLPDRAGWERFQSMIGSGQNGLLPLSQRITLKLANDAVSLYHPQVAQETIVWDWRKDPEIRCGKWRFLTEITHHLPGKMLPDQAAFDAASLPCPLQFSPPKEGETMIPFGRNSAEKIRKLRIDRRIAPEDLPPLLKTTQGEVLWAPKVRNSALFPAYQGERAALFSVKNEEEHL